MRIDSHQHFWKYHPVRDSWITDEMKVIQRDFYPEDLLPVLKEHKIEGCVSVQADQSEEETMFLLNHAKTNPFIKGVVGWVDLKSEKINEQLSALSQFQKLKGFRHVVQAEADGFLDNPDFQRGVKALQSFNFTYDILIYSRQLEEATRFVRKFPQQKFVVDHVAKPVIRENEFASWAKHMTVMGQFENVYCKLSGMVTEAGKNWKPGDFTAYIEHTLACFGTHRVLYGSDWPVCLVAASYAQQLGIVESGISTLSTVEKDSIMGGNAARFYNL